MEKTLSPSDLLTQYNKERVDQYSFTNYNHYVNELTNWLVLSLGFSQKEADALMGWIHQEYHSCFSDMFCMTEELGMLIYNNFKQQ